MFALSDGQPLPRWSFRDTERTPASLTAALGDPDPGVRRLAALDLAGHRPALGAS